MNRGVSWKKKKIEWRGEGKGLYKGYRHFLYYHGLFLDNTLSFETAERLLKYLKDSNTWEQ